MPKDIDRDCIEALLGLFDFDGKPVTTILPVNTGNILLPQLTKLKSHTFLVPAENAPDGYRNYSDFSAWHKEEIATAQPLKFELAVIYARPPFSVLYMSNEEYARLFLKLLDLPIETIIGMVPAALVDQRFEETEGSALSEARSFLTDPRTGEVEAAPDDDYILFSRQ